MLHELHRFLHVHADVAEAQAAKLEALAVPGVTRIFEFGMSTVQWCENLGQTVRIPSQ